MDNNAKIIKTSYIIAGAILLLVLLISVLYSMGYRIQSNFRIGKVGILTVQIPLRETQIIIDQKKKISTSKDSETVKTSLSPGDHEIIISRESYFPWIKKFNVASNSQLALSPIFVSQNPSGSIITEKDPEYSKLKNLILNSTAPSKNKPRISKDLEMKLWILNNSIIISQGVEELVVVEPETKVDNVYFYKDRVDAVLFSTGNGIYVIETSKEGVQNFMPIYKGQNPSFIADDPNFIYVWDNGILMQVTI